MKKILMALLISVLLLPIVVKADMQVLHSYYNDNVIENGEVQVNIPVSYDKEYNWVITYDPTMLRTEESMITISPEKTYKIVNDEPKEQNNLRQVKVSNGKITIKARMDAPEGIIDDDGVPVIILRFTAVKVGETNIKIESKENDFIVSPSISIFKNTNTEYIEIDVNNPGKDPNKEEDPEKEPAKVEEKPKENEKENKDMLFYISIGFNVLLLGAVVALCFMNKSLQKKKEE